MAEKQYTCAFENSNCLHVYYLFNKVTSNFTKIGSITGIFLFFHYFRNNSFEVHVQLTQGILCIDGWSKTLLHIII